MSDGTFKKVEATDERMYGPRGLIVCGYPPGEHGPLSELLEALMGPDLKVCFASTEIESQSLVDILALPHGHGRGTFSDLRRAMIISGCTQRELHALMSSYRQAGLPKQLWATLTPASEGWTLKALLEELAKEAEAVKRQQAGP